MSEFTIRAEKLGKQYKVHRGKRRVMARQALQDMVTSKLDALRSISKSQTEDERQSKATTFWALRDVSFEIKPGESIGIIGNNGAGKSTLLKILSRVTVPTEGRVRLRGRVGSLLEVGTGFHPELTGRENVYFNGSVLGMSRSEINRKFDEIIDFSEVEEFLDTPVKFYSSGMKMRLAFSVAAHLDPDILLVDEILAVGDTAFQKKSLSKMENVVRDGRTVLFVSHNLAVVRSLCARGIFIEKGEVKYIGAMDNAIDIYLSNGAILSRDSFRAVPDQSLSAQIMQVDLEKPDGSLNYFAYDRPLVFNIKVAVRKTLYRVSIGLSIADRKQNSVITSYDFEQDDERLQDKPAGNYSYRVEVPPLLVPGQYRLTVHIQKHGRKQIQTMDSAENICPFEIYDHGSPRSRANIHWLGIVSLPLKWTLSETTESKQLNGGETA
jgi:lipopolysaccharide transport system ATP-binding protein